VAVQPKPDSPLRVTTPLTDLECAKAWIKFCKENHDGACKATGQDIVSTIPSLKFMDCRTRRIVPATKTNEPYAALSYLWGDVGHAKPTSNNLDHLPATIEDALRVTSLLGLKYLWVDRYCINQLSDEDKSSQVAKMDLIYNNAYITIVAAAGSDPTYGLTGVGQRPRSFQPHMKIGRQYCMRVQADPFRTIQRSKWMTRGWCYQEGVLSRRRLIFTDEQMYYECPGMYYWETLNVQLSDLHFKDQSKFQPWLCTTINMGIFPQELGKTSTDIASRISEYSRRDLTDPADALNAFQGILRVFELEGKYHHLGVPIVHDDGKFHARSDDYTPRPTFSPLVGFCEGWLWLTTNSQPRKEPYDGRPVRRLGFPSWSWTGWCAHITWSFWEAHACTILLNAHISIQVQ
ncbi:HET-domain-containing protein, partial [Lophiostoma macrostomum CBS 122681]